MNNPPPPPPQTEATNEATNNAGIYLIIAVAVLAALIAGVIAATLTNNHRTQSTSAPSPIPSATSSQTVNTAPNSAQTQSPQPTPTATSKCLGTNWTLVQDKWCLYPASVEWISDTTILPTQPDQIDWTDPDQVAAAYTQTSLTWDTRYDDSNTTAFRRASIYTHANTTTPDTSNPALSKGQGDYLTALSRGGATSTATIEAIYTPALPPEPLQPDGSWQRAIDYTHTITYHDNTPPTTTTGTLYLILNTAPDGTWLIDTITATAETPAT